MLLTSLVAAALCAAPVGRLELPMPPPPKGMRLVATAAEPPKDKGPEVPLPPPPPGMQLLPAPADGDDDDNLGESEVDEMRALEEATLEPASSSDAALREAVQRLG